MHMVRVKNLTKRLTYQDTPALHRKTIYARISVIVSMIPENW